MTLKRTIHWVFLVAVSTALAGCQAESVDMLTEEPPVATTPAVNNAALTDGRAETTASDVSHPARKLSAAASEFTPPFPNRTELFEPPKRAASSVRRDEEHGETVELKGFINVDEPRAVLSIDGVISPVAEGGEKYGVQVISIQPPSVVLQRGRSRWTATLE